ncbi:unnamed protein product [Protopolystoma xenopodis]|uniref:Uncharacterized protein n=1 Tax=Protopolystoma xenopodis TaxID=117903 RepID=A0A448WJ42_9PLAT|nr:unnamed protein product [Protopolystoma xenopodis]
MKPCSDDVRHTRDERHLVKRVVWPESNPVLPRRLRLKLHRYLSNAMPGPILSTAHWPTLLLFPSFANSSQKYTAKLPSSSPTYVTMANEQTNLKYLM